MFLALDADDRAGSSSRFPTDCEWQQGSVPAISEEENVRRQDIAKIQAAQHTGMCSYLQFFGAYALVTILLIVILCWLWAPRSILFGVGCIVLGLGIVWLVTIRVPHWKLLQTVDCPSTTTFRLISVTCSKMACEHWGLEFAEGPMAMGDDDDDDDDDDEEDASSRVYIAWIHPQSPVYSTYLRMGMVLCSIDGKRPSSAAEARGRLQRVEEGTVPMVAQVSRRTHERRKRIIGYPRERTENQQRGRYNRPRKKSSSNGRNNCRKKQSLPTIHRNITSRGRSIDDEDSTVYSGSLNSCRMIDDIDAIEQDIPYTRTMGDLQVDNKCCLHHSLPSDGPPGDTTTAITQEESTDDEFLGRASSSPSPPRVRPSSPRSNRDLQPNSVLSQDQKVRPPVFLAPETPAITEMVEAFGIDLVEDPTTGRYFLREFPDRQDRALPVVECWWMQLLTINGVEVTGKPREAVHFLLRSKENPDDIEIKLAPVLWEEE